MFSDLGATMNVKFEIHNCLHLEQPESKSYGRADALTDKEGTHCAFSHEDVANVSPKPNRQ
jgi:hypothetical protein